MPPFWGKRCRYNNIEEQNVWRECSPPRAGVSVGLLLKLANEAFIDSNGNFIKRGGGGR